MSDGNGGRKIEARQETGCPLDPSIRPGECNAIHSALLRIEQSVERVRDEHGQALVLISEDVARIKGKLGMRPTAPKPKARARRR